MLWMVCSNSFSPGKNSYAFFRSPKRPSSAFSVPWSIPALEKVCYFNLLTHYWKNVFAAQTSMSLFFCWIFSSSDCLVCLRRNIISRRIFPYRKTSSERTFCISCARFSNAVSYVSRNDFFDVLTASVFDSWKEPCTFFFVKLPCLDPICTNARFLSLCAGLWLGSKSTQTPDGRVILSIA